MDDHGQKTQIKK
ncbi:Protein of unknown function [Escherichia coli D6-117.29]|nr:Protein of unknown function [Escherichia coli D6-117.29]